MNVRRSSCLIVLLALLGLGISSTAMAAKGVCKDGTPPPCKPAVEIGNNLSVPAVHTSDSATAVDWNVPDGTLGGTYSLGCDQEEVVITPTATYSYPNTSCVDSAGVPLTAAECAVLGGPCYGFLTTELDRIYWQKTALNQWWAETIGPVAPVTAAYLDWGDNLESVSWSERSTIRVETTPWTSLVPWVPTPFDPTVWSCVDWATDLGLTDPESFCQLGFQMWHVYGQGPDEQWGVRVRESDLLPYMYETPFGVVHTYGARLHMAKLEPGSAVCPGNDGASTPPEGFVWDDTGVTPRWGRAVGGDACTLRDIPYTAELNVGGRYVYGYNWRLQRDETPSECGVGWLKAGWWRLTFYTEIGDVLFDSLNPVIEPFGPPPAVPAAPTSPPLPVEAEEGEGALYTPVVDYVENLTYLDICIEMKTQGGGGGGGKDNAPGQNK